MIFKKIYLYTREALTIVGAHGHGPKYVEQARTDVCVNQALQPHACSFQQDTHNEWYVSRKNAF